MKRRIKILTAALAIVGLASAATIWKITPGGMAVFHSGILEVRTFSVPYNDTHLILFDGKALLIDTGLMDDAVALDNAIR
ncbi:MAG: hypothetical protein JKY31_05520 [Rhodobacteraceae bacterium]|nr:hypothetical protein [Paracoccaceae bacterium]